MTVTSPYRELNRPTRTLAQALIDGLGPEYHTIRSAAGWTDRVAVENRCHLEGPYFIPTQFGRRVSIHLDGRIRVYDAAGKLEREYKG